MIVIVDCLGANLTSLYNACLRVGYTPYLTSDPKKIELASHVILPGVGHAATAMRVLEKNKLDTFIPKLKQPVLGICLGMQLMYASTEEGNVACMGVFDTAVERVKGNDRHPVPHMGWNRLEPIQTHQVFQGLPQAAYVYYVHSYASPVCQTSLATTSYMTAFTAMAAKENFMGMQFHPERSGKVGEQLLKNFLMWM